MLNVKERRPFQSLYMYILCVCVCVCVCVCLCVCLCALRIADLKPHPIHFLCIPSTDNGPGKSTHSRTFMLHSHFQGLCVPASCYRHLHRLVKVAVLHEKFRTPECVCMQVVHASTINSELDKLEGHCLWGCDLHSPHKELTHTCNFTCRPKRQLYLPTERLSLKLWGIHRHFL